MAFENDTPRTSGWKRDCRPDARAESSVYVTSAIAVRQRKPRVYSARLTGDVQVWGVDIVPRWLPPFHAALA